MNRWKENLGTKKRTGDGAARWARRIFCAFLIVIGVLTFADGVREAAGKYLAGIDGNAAKEGEESRGENTWLIEIERWLGEKRWGLSGQKSEEAEKGQDEKIAGERTENGGKLSVGNAEPDFAALKRQNPDVIAWIRILGTHIDEPIVQAADNEFYRSIGLDGTPDPAGTVFLDCESAPDVSDFHSILYGHHMKDGSRFSELVRLKEEDFFQNHRTAYLYFPDGRKTLRLIAALSADSDGERRRTEFADRAELYSYIEEMTAGCRFRELPDEAVSHLYSFVTCSYEFADARTIVYAVEE